MQKFKNTLSYKFGVIGGYVYILFLLLSVGFKLCINLNILPTTRTGVGPIETIFTGISLGFSILIVLFIVSNIGLGITLFETLTVKKNENIAKENNMLKIINTFSFFVYALFSLPFLIIECFIPPFIPPVILLVYFIFRITKANKNV